MMLMKRSVLVVILYAFFASLFQNVADGQEPVDILIAHGSVITMDRPQRFWGVSKGSP